MEPPRKQRCWTVAAGWLAAVPLLLATGCVSNSLAPSIWPPANFALRVEEVRFEGHRVHVVRRLKVDAQGVVIYGTSSRPLIEAESGLSLPVFDRLAIYQLEPGCLRALSRKVGQLIEEGQANPSSEPSPIGVVMHLRAFDGEQTLTSQGRPRGRFHGVLKEIAGYLPPGESFDVPLRGVRPVLRGVPRPVTGGAQALAAYEALIELCPDDEELLLDGFALACSIAEREAAQQWLGRWAEATAAQRTNQPAFPEGEPRLLPEHLERLLPSTSDPASAGSQ